jgi:hypothetical protein
MAWRREIPWARIVHSMTPPFAVLRPGEYILWAMATNGTAKKANGKKAHAKRTTPRKRAAAKATPAQLRAMRKYLKMAGHKFTKEEIDAVRSQWVD